MSLEQETILLTEKQRKILQKRILHRYHDLGERALTPAERKQIYSKATGIPQQIVDEEIERITRGKRIMALSLVNTKGATGYEKVMEEWQIGYEVIDPANKNLCRVIGYKERKMIFKRCDCGKRMIEIHPIFQDLTTKRIHTAKKEVRYCARCGTNYDNTDNGWD